MKQIRISFLTILTLVTLCLTAATKSDVFKKAKSASIYECKDDIDFIAGDFINSTTGVVAGNRQNDDFITSIFSSRHCPGATDGNYFCAKSLTVCDIPDEYTYFCTNGTEEFCCAEYIDDGEPGNLPCGTNPPGSLDFTTYSVKVKIWCKLAD